MKKYPLILIFLLWAVTLYAAQGVSRGISTGKMLNYSVESLKDSYRDVVRRNAWLLSEAEVYRKNIMYLHKERDALEQEKAELLSGNDQGTTAERFNEDIDILQKEIVLLFQEISFFSEKRFKKVFQLKKKKLLASTEEKGRRIKKAEANLSRAKKQYRKPLAMIEHLRAVQAKLKLKVSKLQDKFQAGISEANQRWQSRLGRNTEDESHLTQLNSELVRLRLYHKKLEKELSQGIVDPLIEVSPRREDVLLNEKINVLRQENFRLKDKMSALKNTSGKY